MLFFSDYNNPGPGISPDEPRAKGLKRIWEVVSRDYIHFWCSGILQIFSILPYLFAVGLGCITHSLLVTAVAGIIGGLIAAPCFYGLADTLLRSLRDEMGFWWHRYSKAIKENWKITLLPGMLFGLIFALQIFILVHVQALEIGLGMFISEIISITVVMGIFFWMLCQQVLMNLSFIELIRNSVLLFFRYIGKSLKACGIALLYIFLLLRLYPGSVFLLITAGLWLPLVCILQIIYPQIDEIFHIEKELDKKQKG